MSTAILLLATVWLSHTGRSEKVFFTKNLKLLMLTFDAQIDLIASRVTLIVLSSTSVGSVVLLLDTLNILKYHSLFLNSLHFRANYLLSIFEDNVGNCAKITCITRDWLESRIPPDAFGTSRWSCSYWWIIYVGIKLNLYKNFPHGTIPVWSPQGWRQFYIRNRHHPLPEFQCC